MREIKFRGKRVDNGEWVYGYYAANHKSGTHYITEQNVLSGCAIPQRVDPATIGQGLGAHDSENEQALFEGDTLEIAHEGRTIRCTVQYESCGFLLAADELLDGYLWISELLQSDREFCWIADSKLIGNIHDGIKEEEHAQ